MPTVKCYDRKCKGKGKTTHVKRHERAGAVGAPINRVSKGGRVGAPLDKIKAVL